MELAKQYSRMELCDFIRQYYPHYITKDLSIATGLPVAKLYSLANRLGVKKSDNLIAQQLEVQAQRLRIDGRVYRFKKGHTPSNKGKKIHPEVYEKAKKTMFKKGRKPHNYKPIGTEVITEDGYIKVKLGDPNIWEFKHRLVWQETNGEIPQGFNIQFKDSNRLNTNLENLYMISRNQQIDQNSIVRYPADIRKAIHRISKLKKTIKQYETD